MHWTGLDLIMGGPGAAAISVIGDRLRNRLHLPPGWRPQTQPARIRQGTDSINIPHLGNLLPHYIMSKVALRRHIGIYDS